MAALKDRLKSTYPTVIGKFNEPPGGLVFQGAQGRTGQIVPGTLALTTALNGNHEIDSALAAEWVAKHWLPVFDAFKSCGAPARFAALVADVEMSTVGIEAAEHDIIARYIKLPEWPQLADAEFRVAKIVADAYYLNFGFSCYKSFRLTFGSNPDAEKGGQAELTPLDESESDHGLKVRLDVNTKVNIMRNLGDIEVTAQHVERSRFAAAGRC